MASIFIRCRGVVCVVTVSSIALFSNHRLCVWRGTWSQDACSQQVVSNFRENKRAGEIKNVGRFANESFR